MGKSASSADARFIPVNQESGKWKAGDDPPLIKIPETGTKTGLKVREASVGK